MKLNKPLITICLIILLVINLIFFSFLSIGNNLSNREYINDIIEDFDFKEYLLNSYNIKKSIDEYKYPKEVFDYLNTLKIDELKKNIVDNLFDQNEYLVDKDDIIEILNESVYEFESNRSKDIYSYVEKDIYNFSDIVSKKINKDFSDGYYTIEKISKVFYSISIIISISLISIIILMEKRNGFLISSIILAIYSFFVYYVNNYFLEFILKEKMNYFDKLDLGLDNTYIICFILGFVLLLIYIVKTLRRFAREIRVSSYNRR